MDISCAFPPTPETPQHIALAEQLGYKRAWAYDTPALQLDVWMTLARAAERTTRIELGPSAIIPHLRHVMTTAAAIATLYDLAPGRVNVALGAGFTARLAMGQRPLSWALVTQYTRQLRTLLAGEIVEIDGSPMKMLHGPGQAPARPINVPILLAAAGPKGLAAAREVADGILTPVPTSGFDWSILTLFGTVLDPNESPGASRVIAAAGPGLALLYHAAFERGAARIDSATLPHADRWREAVQAIPERVRHLRIHEGHLTYLNEFDARVITDDLIMAHTVTGEANNLIMAHTFTGEADDLRIRLAKLAETGITEVSFQPCGPDIERELTAFAKVAGIV